MIGLSVKQISGNHTFAGRRRYFGDRRGNSRKRKFILKENFRIFFLDS